MQLIRRGAELEIVTRWFNRNTLVLTAFTILWLGFFAFLAWGVFEVPIPVLFFFLVVGLLCAYRSAAEWMNRTSVKAGTRSLSVRHGPIPWPGSKEMAASEIKELQIRNSLVGQGSDIRRTVYKLEVHALLVDGKRVKLLGGFASAGEAKLMLLEIEGGLGRLKGPAGAQGDPGHVGVTKDVNTPTGRAIAGVFGFVGVAAGLYVVESVVELYQQGYPPEHQLIRVLAGAWILSFGAIFLGLAFHRMNARVASGLLTAMWVLPVVMFILIALFGTGFSKAPYFMH